MRPRTAGPWPGPDGSRRRRRQAGRASDHFVEPQGGAPGFADRPGPDELGWHVVEARPYDEVADSLAALSTPAGDARRSYLGDLDVHVDPRYGRWDARPRTVVASSDVGCPARPSPSSGSGPAATSTSPSRRSTRSRASRTASCARPATRAPTSCRTPTTFDDLYEAADRFDDVYAAIVDALVAAAAEHGEVLYAVPGSPLVLERSVRSLLADDRVRCDVLPAMSFLDVAWARLGIDPVEAGVRLVDGHEFATAAAGATGRRCWSPTPTPTGCCPTSSWPSRRRRATSRW